MPDVPDVVNAWREAANQLLGLAASIAGQAGQGAPDILGPLQRQTEIIEQFLRQQVDTERDIVRRAFAPAQAMADALAQAPDGMRAQATAFRAAATSFTQAAELLDLQAATLEQTVAALKAPGQLVQRGLRRRS